MSLKTTLLTVFIQNMGVNVSENDITLTCRFRMNKTSQSQNSLKKFHRFLSKLQVKVIQKYTRQSPNWLKLVSTFEAHTKRRRDLMYLARDKYGVKNMWSDRD